MTKIIKRSQDLDGYTELFQYLYRELGLCARGPRGSAQHKQWARDVRRCHDVTKHVCGILMKDAARMVEELEDANS